MIIFYRSSIYLIFILPFSVTVQGSKINKIASLLTVHVHMYWEVTHFPVTVVTVNMGNKVCILAYCLPNKGLGVCLIQVSLLAVNNYLELQFRMGIFNPNVCEIWPDTTQKKNPFSSKVILRL